MGKADTAAQPAKTKVGLREVEEYLAAVPEPARATLEKVRAAIRAVVPPEAIECLSYRVPSFRLTKPVVGYAAFSTHCSLFPMSGAVIAALAEDLKGYQTSKGTIQFPLNKPLPTALLKKIVQKRLAEIGA